MFSQLYFSENKNKKYRTAKVRVSLIEDSLYDGRINVQVIRFSEISEEEAKEVENKSAIFRSLKTREVFKERMSLFTLRYLSHHV